MRATLLTCAIAASTIAVLGTTPTPIIGGRDAIQRLAIGAAIICWLAWFGDRLATRNQQRTTEVRNEVGRFRELTEVEGLFRAAGYGHELHTPIGKTRTEVTEIDGRTVLWGVDRAAELAPVVELKEALQTRKAGHCSGSNGKVNK